MGRPFALTAATATLVAGAAALVVSVLASTVSSLSPAAVRGALLASLAAPTLLSVERLTLPALSELSLAATAGLLPGVAIPRLPPPAPGLIPTLLGSLTTPSGRGALGVLALAVTRALPARTRPTPALPGVLTARLPAVPRPIALSVPACQLVVLPGLLATSMPFLVLLLAGVLRRSGFERVLTPRVAVAPALAFNGLPIRVEPGLIL